MTSETFQPTGTDSPNERKGGRGYVVPVLLVLVTVSFYLNAIAPSAGPPPGWGNSFEAAMAEAVASRKPVVVAFYADG